MKIFLKRALFLMCALILVFGLVGCPKEAKSPSGGNGGGTDKVYGTLSTERKDVVAPETAGTITVTGAANYTGSDINAAWAAISAVESGDITMTLTDGTYKVADGTNLKYDGAANITIAGDSKTPYGLSVLIEGNPGTKAQKEREIIYMTEKSTGSLTLEYITVRNNFAFTGTSDVQAEVVATAGTGNLAAYNCSFLSGQDTLRTTGKAWFYECYIEGDVDFLWMESTGIVALYEKCIIRAIDDRVNNAYFTAPRAGVTSKTGKGLVIYNSTLESEAADTYLGRNPWASSYFEDYYNNVAIVDSPLYLEADATLNSKIWKGASHGTNDQQYVGFKTDDYYASSTAGIGAILSSTVEKAEYAGRENILNRLYNIPSSKFVKDSENFWNLESLISTRNWTVTEDTSKSLLDGEVETVSRVYDFTSATANGYTDAELDGFAYESGKTHAKGVAGNTITIPVTGKGIVYVYGYYPGNGTIKVNNQGVGIYDFNNGSTNTFVEKPYVNYSGAGDVIITAENASYIAKVVVEYDDTLTYTPVTGIEITSSSDSYTVGIPVVLSAVVSPATATNTDVVWSSSDESVGTINKYTGEVKFLTQGTVKFTVRACDGSNIAKEITCEPSEATWTSAEWYDTKDTSSTTTSGSGTGLGGSAGENNSIFTLGTTSGVTLGEEKEVTLIDGTTKKISTGIKMNSSGTVTFAVAKNAKVKVLAGYCSDSNATTDYIKITASGDGAVATPYPTNPNGVQTQDVEYEWTLTPGLYTISRGGTGYAPAIYYVRVDIGDFKIEIPATDLTVAPTTANVVIGSTTQLTATVTPSNSTDNVEWTSSDTSVATVDNTGLVTGVKAGTATITAKAGEKEAKCTVTVTTGAVAATGITLDKATASVTKGETLTLTATVTPSDSTDAITWTTSDENVATVANGVVTAVGVGEATITATAGEVNATCAVTVVAYANGTYTLSDSTISQGTALSDGTSSDGAVSWSGLYSNGNDYAYTTSSSKVTVQVAGSSIITLTGCYKGTNGKTLTVTDSSSNTVISGVYTSSEQILSFLYSGDATTLTIAWSGQAYITAIQVDDGTGVSDEITDVTISGTTTCTVGATINLSATVSCSYINTDTSVTWSSSDETIATVDDNGVVTGVAAGTAKITATSVFDSTKSGSIDIEVSAEPFDATNATVSIDLSSNDINIQSKKGTIPFTVKGSTDYDLTVYVDATTTSGKLAGDGTKHAQMNAGTVIKVPVSDGAVVSVTASSAGAQYALYTIAGTAASTTELTSTYTHSGDATWIDIISTGTAYPAAIEITGLNLENNFYGMDDYIWTQVSFASKSTGFEGNVGEFYGLVIDATSGKYKDNGGGWIQCNTGTIVYVPVIADATIVVSAYATGYTITGGESTVLTDNGDKTYTYNFVYETDAVEVEGYDGKFAKLTMGTDGYWGDISLEY
ncbi:MAG: Ig-like domain-containing protein [Spirochaetaceae bacterium]|nr:Ig-like domain-containing protein [Spirochaetaceae bacterium]